MNAAEAIAESKRLNAGKPFATEAVVLDHFTYEDEVALQGACADFYLVDEANEDHTRYVGAGWRVELVGNGDPQ